MKLSLFKFLSFLMFKSEKLIVLFEMVASNNEICYTTLQIWVHDLIPIPILYPLDAGTLGI